MLRHAPWCATPNPLVRVLARNKIGCRSSVVEHILGKDEAESSILSDSTIITLLSLRVSHLCRHAPRDSPYSQGVKALNVHTA